MKLSFGVQHFKLSWFSLKITLKVIISITIITINAIVNAINAIVNVVKFVGWKFTISAGLLMWLCHVTFVQVFTSIHRFIFSH